MSYCPECGEKINENNKKEKTNHKKNNFLKASGVLTTNAASLCFLIGVIGLLAFSSGTWYYYEQPYYYPETYYGPYHYNVPMPQYVLTAAFGFFAFIIGLASGILILIRKLYNLTLIGQIAIIVAAIMLLTVEFWFFLLLGVPIIVMIVLSIVFTSISKNDFLS